MLVEIWNKLNVDNVVSVPCQSRLSFFLSRSRNGVSADWGFFNGCFGGLLASEDHPYVAE